MKNVLQVLTLCLPAMAASAPVWSTSGELGEQKLVWGEGAATLTWTPPEGSVFIQQQGDFNGDGVLDALVIASELCAACASDIYFATLKAGRLVTMPITASGNLPQVRQEGDQWFIEIEGGGGREVYVIDGDRPVAYTTIKAPVLKAIAEIHGPGLPVPAEDSRERALLEDVDFDGKPETIRCSVWERWGELWCGLPLPNGGVQESHTGCLRFGVLPTKHKGRREFVCDDNLVIRFDGKAWVEVKPGR